MCIKNDKEIYIEDTIKNQKLDITKLQSLS